MNNHLQDTDTLFMDRLRNLAKPISYLAILSMLALGIQLPAQAAIISTEAVVNAQQAQQDRNHLQEMLSRDEVKQQLLAAGVDPTQATARIDALSDQEVHQLNAKMDQMPAGGDALAIAAFVFIVLLITDILGFTDIFPFVKKPAR